MSEAHFLDWVTYQCVSFGVPLGGSFSCRPSCSLGTDTCVSVASIPDCGQVVFGGA